MKGTGDMKTKRATETEMYWKPKIHQTMRDLYITTEDAPDRDRWRFIISEKRN